MSNGLDPELQRKLATIKELAALQHQTPTKEWPLVFVEEHGSVLVLREWPGGGLTAFIASDRENPPRKDGES
jgi:hypothetical protein